MGWHGTDATIKTHKCTDRLRLKAHFCISKCINTSDKKYIYDEEFSKWVNESSQRKPIYIIVMYIYVCVLTRSVLRFFCYSFNDSYPLSFALLRSLALFPFYSHCFHFCDLFSISLSLILTEHRLYKRLSMNWLVIIYEL